MARVGTAHRRDAAGMTRRRQPVSPCRPDRTTSVRPFAFGAGRPAGDQQQHAVAACDRALQSRVEQRMSGSERMAMKVKRRVGRDQPARNAPVPAAVQGVARTGPLTRSRRQRAPPRRQGGGRGGGRGDGCGGGRPRRLAGRWQRRCYAAQRPHARHHLPPEARLLRVERTHSAPMPTSAVPPFRPAATEKRCRALPCHLQSAPPRRPRPRRYPRGWHP